MFPPCCNPTISIRPVFQSFLSKKKKKRMEKPFEVSLVTTQLYPSTRDMLNERTIRHFFLGCPGAPRKWSAPKGSLVADRSCLSPEQKKKKKRVPSRCPSLLKPDSLHILTCMPDHKRKKKWRVLSLIRGSEDRSRGRARRPPDAGASLLAGHSGRSLSRPSPPPPCPGRRR